VALEVILPLELLPRRNAIGIVANKPGVQGKAMLVDRAVVAVKI
jgi:hypothetical protein